MVSRLGVGCVWRDGVGVTVHAGTEWDFGSEAV